MGGKKTCSVPGPTSQDTVPDLNPGFSTSCPASANMHPRQQDISRVLDTYLKNPKFKSWTFEKWIRNGCFLSSKYENEFVF